MSQVDAGTLVRPVKRSRSTSNATDRAAEARSTTVKDVKQDEKLKKIEKALRGLKPELKYKDYAHNAVVDYNGTIYDISSTVAQGTTDNTRIGDALVIKGFKCIGHAGSTAAVNSVFRVLFVLDKHATITTVGEVLKTTGSLAGVDSQYVFDAIDKRSEAIVLADKRFTIGGNGTSRANGLFDFNVKLKYPARSDYLAASTSCSKNALLMIMISDQAPTSTAQLVANTRMYFTDP